jgi:hypothetical protein
LLEEVAMHLVLIPEVVVSDEKADLDPGPADVMFRAVRKEQAGGTI